VIGCFMNSTAIIIMMMMVMMMDSENDSRAHQLSIRLHVGYRINEALHLCSETRVPILK
jgi:hypothetical protein